MAGENYWNRDSHTLYVVIKGQKTIEIKTADTFIISFQFPPLTADEFFGDRLVQVMAAYFDLDPSKIRVVDVVRNTGPTGRKKRSTSNDEVIFEVGNSPAEGKVNILN